MGVSEHVVGELPSISEDCCTYLDRLISWVGRAWGNNQTGLEVYYCRYGPMGQGTSRQRSRERPENVQNADSSPVSRALGAAGVASLEQMASSDNGTCVLGMCRPYGTQRRPQPVQKH